MIQLLSNDTIQKIAAGEVIERPSSVVKELVENSIDAGSSRIVVEIRNGGIDYIEVTDNGNGIEKNDIELAFKRHATSKLSKFIDIYNLNSLGFRGEALASIVSVSKVSVATKTIDDKIGTKVEFENGQKINEKPVGKNIGTSIIVKDLFYNIPVRKKFLKNSNTEANHITNLMYKLAVGNYNIGITYIKDDKIVFETKENEELSTNLTELFGIDIVDNLLDINFESSNYNIKGFISNNKYYRANRSLQYIYINNRYIENRNIRESVEHSYKSIIPNGRFPIFQLFIKINPQLLDVNIHPNKEKVEITLLKDIVEDIENIISKRLYSNINLPKLEHNDKEIIKENILFNEKKDIQNLLEKFDHDKNSILDTLEKSTDNNESIYSIKKEDIFNNNLIKEEEAIYKESTKENENIEIKNINIPQNIDEYKIEEINFMDFNDEKLYKFIGIIFKTYIIYEDLSTEKILIVDQHAAHERVLYEKFMKDFQNNEIIVQNLLIPINVELKNDEMQLFIKNKEIFDKIGFEINIFGDNSVIIRTVPNILGKTKDTRFFLDILDSLNSKNKELGYDSIYEKIIKNSCKNAVKSGDSLSKIEINGLLAKLMKCDNPFTCPHGRPTLIEMTKYELEKSFMRVK